MIMLMVIMVILMMIMKKLTNIMTFESKLNNFEDEYFVRRGPKKWGRAPPPDSGNAQKKTLFFGMPFKIPLKTFFSSDRSSYSDSVLLLGRGGGNFFRFFCQYI